MQDLDRFPSLEDEIARKCLRVLSAICGRRKVLPKSYLYTICDGDDMNLDIMSLSLETPKMKTVGINTVVLPIHHH